MEHKVKWSGTGAHGGGVLPGILFCKSEKKQMLRGSLACSPVGSKHEICAELPRASTFLPNYQARCSTTFCPTSHLRLSNPVAHLRAVVVGCSRIVSAANAFNEATKLEQALGATLPQSILFFSFFSSPETRYWLID